MPFRVVMDQARMPRRLPLCRILMEIKGLKHVTS
jgi:hypothetical protein